MPTQVQIPDGTLLEFPDGMSEDDMRSAIYSNFPDLDPKAGYESEEVVSSETSRAEKRAGLVKEMEGARREGMFAESMANVAGAAEATAKAITNPIEFVKQTERGVEAAATLITGSPQELMVKPSDILQRPLAKIPDIPPQESVPGQVAAGVGNAVIGFANFMQTPEGVAMLGIVGLPEGIRRGVTAAISAQMATHAPEAFKAAVEAAEKGDIQSVAKHTTEFLGGTAMSALAAQHSVSTKGTTVAKLEAANAPLTAEAVKQTEAGKAEAPKVEPVKDEIPTVDLAKAEVVPPESVGYPPVEAPKVKPIVPIDYDIWLKQRANAIADPKPVEVTKPATPPEPIKSEPVVEPKVTADIIPAKTEAPKPVEAKVEEHARTTPVEDPFERARRGDEKAFDDLDAQFREVWPDPPELESRAGRAQVHTPQAFRKLFDEAFAARDFDRILDAVKATSDKSVWKPYLQELFAAQAKDPLAAKKADWFRAVFNGTRPADALPPKAPKAAPSAGPTSPPPPRPGTGTSAPPPPKPPPTPPAPPPSRIAVNPIAGGGAKSPFKIIEDFENALGKAIRVRRQRPGTLGTYAPGSTQATRRFASDLDTTAHELAHWFDDKFGIGKAWVTPKTRSPYDSELAKFWIHGSVTPRSTLRYRRAEGIAEYIRAYIVNPAQAMRDAPTFTAYFERTVPPKALNAIRQFSNDVRTWAGEDPLRRAGLNIRMEPPTLTERLWNGIRGRGFGFEISPIDRLRLWFDDPYHYAVKAFGEAVEMRGGLPVKPEHNFELLSRLLATHDARMTDQFERGLVGLKPGQKGSGRTMEVERAIDPVTKEPMSLEWLLNAFEKTSREVFDQDMRDASAYMVAERTIEKSKQLGRKDNISGIGAGIFTDVEAARQLLSRVASEPAREQRLKEASRRYRLWADHNIQMLVDAGRMSAEQAKDIRKDNQFYVDMHRLSQEFEFQNREQRGVKIGTTRDVVKRFRGSSLELDNVYSNLLEQTDSIQKEAHRNMTMRTFTDMISQVRELHGPNLKEFEVFGAKAKAQDRNTITVYDKGHATHWKFAPEIHESLKGLGDLGTHAVIDFLALLPRFSRYMITHSPQFIARNVTRDTIQRTVNSRNQSMPWDILKGYSAAELSRFKVFGGGQFGNYIVDQHVWNRVLKDVSRDLVKDPTNILVSPLKLKRGWEKLAESSENLGRIAEFRRAFEKGKDELGYDDYNAALYAAGEARGLLDFAKAGTVMRVINRLVPFSNARLRGLARSLATVKEDPKGFALRWGTAVVVPTVLTMLWNRRDKETWDEYTQQPGYLRDFFWSFKVGDYWLRIPKPHELGVMASGVERAISRAMGEQHAMEGWGKDATQAALPVGDPVEMTGPLKTFLELEFNRDTFRDRDIIPYWEKDLKLELRKGKEHASGTGKGLAEILNAAGMEVDPRQMDHLLQSYGGIGQIATSGKNDRPLSDTALKSTGYVVDPPIANARDVQWVMDWAKRNGQDGAIKDLKDMRKAVLEEKDVKERARKGKMLREKATQMRDQIEAREAKP